MYMSVFAYCTPGQGCNKGISKSRVTDTTMTIEEDFVF